MHGVGGLFCHKGECCPDFVLLYINAVQILVCSKETRKIRHYQNSCELDHSVIKLIPRSNLQARQKLRSRVDGRTHTVRSSSIPSWVFHVRLQHVYRTCSKSKRGVGPGTTTSATLRPKQFACCCVSLTYSWHPPKTRLLYQRVPGESNTHAEMKAGSCGRQGTSCVHTPGFMYSDDHRAQESSSRNRDSDYTSPQKCSRRTGTHYTVTTQTCLPRASAGLDKKKTLPEKKSSIFRTHAENPRIYKTASPWGKGQGLGQGRISVHLAVCTKQPCTEVPQLQQFSATITEVISDAPRTKNKTQNPPKNTTNSRQSTKKKKMSPKNTKKNTAASKSTTTHGSLQSTG